MTQAEPKYAIFGSGKPHPDSFHTYDEWMENIAALNAAFSQKARVIDEVTGEDITDLVPKPEAASVVWDRFNRKMVTP